MNEILTEAKGIENELISLRRNIHKNAEIGFSLEKTSSLIKEKLREYGYIPKDIAKCGVYATLGEGDKCILLRADCDALVMEERSNEEFSSKNGNSHACGHDMHTAMLLGAAKLLKMHEKELKCTVKLFFQPAEELLLGANEAIRCGIMENPKVDAAVTLHTMTAIPYECGTVIIPSENVTAPAADFFEISVKGRSSHGAAVQNSKDATAIAARILLALDEVCAKELSPKDEALISIGKFSSGSSANVISDLAILEGTLRCAEEDTREKIKERIRELAKGYSALFGGIGEVNFLGGAPVLKNDERMCRAAQKALKEEFGNRLILTEKMDSGTKRSMGGSEDFAHFSNLVPSVLLGITAGNAKRGYIHPLHHPEVRFDERALLYGASAFALCALHFNEK